MVKVDDLEFVREVVEEVTREDIPKSVYDVSNEDFPQTDANSKFTFIYRNFMTEFCPKHNLQKAFNC